METKRRGANGNRLSRIGPPWSSNQSASPWGWKGDDNGIQIININDPANPIATASITDNNGGFTSLAGASEIHTTNINGNTYALVTARDDNGIQIININDPSNPTAIASITDGAGGFDELQLPTDITTIQIRGFTMR